MSALKAVLPLGFPKQSLVSKLLVIHQSLSSQINYFNHTWWTRQTAW